MTAVTPDLAAGTRGGAGRVLLLALGVLAALAGATLVAAGGVALWVDRLERDSTGYLNTSTEQFLTRSYALTTEPLEIRLGGAREWFVDEDVFGDVRLRAESADGDVGVFVGIAPTADVERYLARVEHDRISELDARPFRATYVREAGGAPPAAPGRQSFWAASASGRGLQTLTWEARSGEWTVVAMNADGSPGVHVRVQAGAELGLLDWLAAILIGVGLLAVGAGAAAIVSGRRRPAAAGGAGAETLRGA